MHSQSTSKVIVDIGTMSNSSTKTLSVLINVKGLLFHECYFRDQEDDNLSLGLLLGYCPFDEKKTD